MREDYPETRAVTLDEARNLAGSAKRGPEPDTIGDDLSRRLASVDDHLLILNERLAIMANKIMGPGPDEAVETLEKGSGLVPMVLPLVERLSAGIHMLERRAKRLQETIDRFSGLV